MMLRTLVISPSAIGLTAALLAAPAIAGHKANHNPGGGGGNGGGDATFEITLENIDGGLIASGDGVEGAGGSIDGLTEPGSFESIALDAIPTLTPEVGNVAGVYNSVCETETETEPSNINAIGPSEAIGSIRVINNAEIETLTVVVDYSVDGQSFTLLMEEAYTGDFPTALEDFPLTHWSNRGGGKGKKNRCGTGHPKDLDGVLMDIVQTSP